MFKNLFKKKSPVVEKTNSPAPANPAAAAMKRVIEEKRKDDPLIGAKIGGKEVVQRVMGALKNDKGVHVESLLSALGSLAGYACQASVRAEYVDGKGEPENQVFAIAGGEDGKSYFFGDRLNQPLAESKYSVWGLVAGAAQQMGATDGIDLNDIFKHVAATVGSQAFGIPRIPESNSPANLPMEYLTHFWPKLHPLAAEFCAEPSEWPILYGLAIQEVMDMAQGVIDPTLALSIVMESAVPMSKVDLSQ